MLKAPAVILGVKSPSNQHCIGGGGGMHEFAVFLRKCPKTFGQDCSFQNIAQRFERKCRVLLRVCFRAMRSSFGSDKIHHYKVYAQISLFPNVFKNSVGRRLLGIPLLIRKLPMFSTISKLKQRHQTLWRLLKLIWHQFGVTFVLANEFDVSMFLVFSIFCILNKNLPFF